MPWTGKDLRNHLLPEIFVTRSEKEPNHENSDYEIYIDVAGNVMDT